MIFLSVTIFIIKYLVAAPVGVDVPMTSFLPRSVNFTQGGHFSAHFRKQFTTVRASLIEHYGEGVGSG